jgi:uncharacterized protein YjbJ (UPF0337 family)
MNTDQPKKKLTFGEYVSSVYKTCGNKRANLTDDDLQFAEGKQDEMLGRIQKLTGESREVVEKVFKNASSSK